jgi:hypothetical protein
MPSSSVKIRVGHRRAAVVAWLLLCLIRSIRLIRGFLLAQSLRVPPRLSPTFFLPITLLALSLLSGCQRSPAIAPPVPKNQATAQIDPPAAPKSPAPVFAEPPADNLDGGRLIEETWDAVSMQDTRVGFARTTVASVQENGRDLIRTSSLLHMEINRDGNPTTQEMVLTSYDTPDGQLVRFDSQMSSGSSPIKVVGAVNNGQLGIDQTTLGRTQSIKIPWQPAWGGFFAQEQSLRRQPLKPGEKRTIHCLLPGLNIPGDVHFEALTQESVELPAGKQTLLKIKSVMEAGPSKIESLLWANDRGEVLKMIAPTIQQEVVRTTKADALNPPAGGSFDLITSPTVKITGPLVPTPNTTRAVYRAHLKTGQIAGLFTDCPSQRVKPIDNQTAELTVLASSVVGTLRVPSLPNNSPPTDNDLHPNNFIQSDDPVIHQLAAHVAPRETDPWAIACALEKFVSQAVNNKNFSTAFATAAEVARSLEGDCTEHAVLMAALCRARKIPARTAFGLIYYPPEKGFAYHMWNEVWIADRWIPMDSTLGLGGIAADHIQLGHSNLAGSSTLADLLSVIQVFNQLELEVLAIE